MAWFCNYYQCARCGYDWTDEWSCTCEDDCPECGVGKVYRQKDPKTLVRIVGRPPLEATRYEMERLRCNGCGEVFTADEPAEAGAEKYDETAAAMIAQLRYGSGMPFQTRFDAPNCTAPNWFAGAPAIW